MRIRPATEDDRDELRGLWEEFEAEVPPPPGFEETWDEAWRDLSRHVREGAAFVVEDEGGLFAYAFAAKPDKGRAHLTDAYVRPHARRRGVMTALVGQVASAVRELGANQLSLEVQTTNGPARAAWERLGFVDVMRFMAAPLDSLQQRVTEAPPGDSFGSIHVQTDDRPAVERAVRQFVPRLRGGSRGTVVAPPANGWTAVYDELCDREPAMLRRLARELSDRMGAVVVALGLEEGSVVRYVLLERGRVVDEYVSLPEYHGPLPPGDVVAFAANPTAVARLTGADAARVRAVARTAATARDLPRPPDLLSELAATLGLRGGDHGYERAREIPGALLIER